MGVGMEIRTPRYMIREELERKQMSSRAARRAYGFERRLDEERGGELEDMFGGGKRECEERKKRVRSGKEGFLRKKK